jgi:hypothetical protein
MVKSYQERQAAKVDKFVASLTSESEFFGLLGEGYPGSLYKVYARETKDSKRWWVFEIGAGPASLDPIKNQAHLKVKGRAAAVWAPLPFLANYTHHPVRNSIPKLLARAAELRQGGARVTNGTKE